MRNIPIATALGLVLTIFSAGLLQQEGTAMASDHLDSPTITQDRGSDLGDSWAFLDPNDNSKLVVVMTTQNFMTQGEAPNKTIFDPNVRYRIEIENTGDASPDAFIDVRYSRGVGRGTAQTARISVLRRDDRRRDDDDDDDDDYGRDDDDDDDDRRRHGRRGIVASFTALTTVATLDDLPPQQVVTNDPDSGMSFFAGQTEDPFFLDNTAAGRYIGTAVGGVIDTSLLLRGRDTYAGYNVLATVVSVPVDLISGSDPVIGINTVTQRQRKQIVTNGADVVGFGRWLNVDRDGFALINNALIPSDRKNEFNSASTEDDAAGRFEDDIVATLQALGSTPETIDALLDLFVRRGDFMRLDLRISNTGPYGGTNPAASFPNGRRLADDAVDIFFTMFNNGVPLSDNVDANENELRSVFPFVADSLQPFPSGTIDDLTRN